MLFTIIRTVFLSADGNNLVTHSGRGEHQRTSSLSRTVEKLNLAFPGIPGQLAVRVER
jgi:hypothetical protein